MAVRAQGRDKHHGFLKGLQRPREPRGADAEQARDRGLYRIKRLTPFLAKVSTWQKTVQSCICGKTYINANRAHHMKSRGHELNMKEYIPNKSLF